MGSEKWRQTRLSRFVLFFFSGLILFAAFIFCSSVNADQIAPGTIVTVAGGSDGDGGLATNAALQPICVATDTKDNIYIDDYGNSSIRKMDPSAGIITTVAGNGRQDSAVVV